MRTIACLLLITGCATDELSTRTSAMTKPDGEQMLCDPNACFIHRCRDSDTDGICDIDEKMFDCDPDDHFSRPDFRDVLAKLRELPSFQAGQSMVIVLPTIGPDGQAVFGGNAMLPARHDLLKRIGVELPEGAPDLSDGLTLVRSLESANTVEFGRPPWTQLEPPSADTTRDAGTAESSIGTAVEGLGTYEFKFSSMSSNDGYRFSTFSFTDKFGHAYTGSSQTGPTYSSTKVETHEANSLDSYEYDNEIVVVTTVSESGNTITIKTTTTHYSSSDGKEKWTKTTKKTTANSADGTEHVVETEKDGYTETHWWIDGWKQSDPSPPGDYPEPAPDAGDGTAYAHSDPEYVEYVASPETIDTILLLREGPVHVVNPLSEEGEENFIPGLDNHLGPVSLFAPDAASTSINEPLVIHMPFGGDHNPDEEEAPAGDGTYQGGQCLYCNQGGN
jgi:hypothetical protein